MEDNLRERAAELETQGLTQDEAICVAMMRIGRTADVTREYMAVDPATVWARRVVWMIVGFVGLSMALSIIPVASALAVLLVAATTGLESAWLYAAIHVAVALLGLTLLLSGMNALSHGRLHEARLMGWCPRPAAVVAGMLLLTLLGVFATSLPANLSEFILHTETKGAVHRSALLAYLPITLLLPVTFVVFASWVHARQRDMPVISD